MTSMGRSVPQRMIAHAGILVATHGYHGTSFSAILKASKAPRGSVYHHFPEGKEQLVGAAIDVVGNLSVAATDSLCGKSAVEIVDGFVALWSAILVGSDFQSGCAALAVTVGSDVPDLVARASAAFKGWEDSLTRAFRKAGFASAKSRELALTLIAASEGATVLCRAYKSLKPMQAVANQLRQLVTEAPKN